MAHKLPSLALLLCALCVFCIGQTNANVIGFDFGTSFFKITLVKPATPFSIVENVTSKRKTETMMTIDSEERKFGVDSFNSATKFPKTTFTEAASFLGRDFDQEEVDRLKTDRMVMNEMV
jgi:molecular chaperone DnaK (HSP70)